MWNGIILAHITSIKRVHDCMDRSHMHITTSDGKIHQMIDEGETTYASYASLITALDNFYKK